MCGWKKWSGAVFPRLQKLEIRNCPNLVEVTHEALPSLNILVISSCPNLVELKLEALPSLNALQLKECDSGLLESLVEIASAVTELNILNISGLNDVVWRGVIEYLGAVKELCIQNCNDVRYVVKSDAVVSNTLVKLRKLNVRYCDKLVSIGEKEEEEEDNCRSNILPSLRTLNVSHCKNMERCSCPDGIEELSVEDCSSVTVVSFPKGGQEKLRSLSIHDCSKLLERVWGGQEMNNSKSSMPMLESIRIGGWPNLKSIIELNSLVHLTRLSIYDCENLESFPEKLTSLKYLSIRKCPKLDGSFLSDNMTSLEGLFIDNCPRMDASLPGWVWPPNLRSLEIGNLKKPFSEWGPQKKFPTSLVKLYLLGDGEDGVDSCSQFSHILPSSLTSLWIRGFEKLESVVSMGHQHLTSLQHLTFWDCPNLKKVCLHPQHLSSLRHLSFHECPKMKDLPQLLLPSLLSLRIWGDCPDLKERCSKNGTYWPLISHIPYL